MKTIVFISHDFDEAIGLSDIIAIMYEGEIGQLGTAEELITNPATDYVEAFTRDIPCEKLLTVGSMMEAGSGTGSSGVSVRASAVIATVVGTILAESGPINVTDDDGATIGTITRD